MFTSIWSYVQNTFSHFPAAANWPLCILVSTVLSYYERADILGTRMENLLQNME